MDKLRREQIRGYPDLWMQSGGEDKIVAELSAFGNLKKKCLGTAPCGKNWQEKFLMTKLLKKKKWLYTVWHSDRKFIRTRALLRQKKINLFAFRNYENENNDAKTESDWEVIKESDTEEKALEEMPPKNEDVKNRDTISEIKETHEEMGQDETEIFQKETTVDPNTAEKSA